MTVHRSRSWIHPCWFMIHMYIFRCHSHHGITPPNDGRRNHSPVAISIRLHDWLRYRISMLRFIDFMIRFMARFTVDCTPIRYGHGTRFIIHLMNTTTWIACLMHHVHLMEPCITLPTPTHSLLLPRRGMIGRVHPIRRGHPLPQYKDIHANMDIGVSWLSGSGGIVTVEGC